MQVLESLKSVLSFVFSPFTACFKSQETDKATSAARHSFLNNANNTNNKNDRKRVWDSAGFTEKITYFFKSLLGIDQHNPNESYEPTL